ncbi:MAG: T9SS type A sorting domain-containing protein [Bacteroidetes bacterium]|nr:T9SS type A sorting domain-containing protein [Bacteroidota bacterium]
MVSDVIIENDHTVTVNVTNAECASLIIGDGGGVAYMNFSGLTPSLTVTGNVDVGFASNHGNRVGVLTFTSDATLTAGSVSLNENFNTTYSEINMAAGGTLITGALAIAGESSVGATWTPGIGTVEITATNTLPSIIFTNFEDLHINAGSTTVASNITINDDLIIADSASLILNSTVFFTVIDKFTLNGSECIILESDTNGRTASLLSAGTIYGSGTVRFERYFKGGEWHYFTPVIQGTPSNCFNQAALYEYNPASSSWSSIGPNDTLTLLNGYDVYFKNNTTVSIIGTPYQGSKNRELINYSNGYNFVGNPYLSAVDWDNGSGWTKLLINNSTYVWDPSTSAVSSYVNGNATNGGSQFIPASQGYFVSVLTGGTAKLTVNGIACTHHDIKMRAENSKKNSLTLKLEDANLYDETVVYFDDQSTEYFDGQYDAYKLDGNSINRTTIYSKTNDGKDLSINAIPENRQGNSITLYLSAGPGGLKKLSVSGLDNFATDMDVFIEDLVLNKMINMKTGEYSFMYEPIVEEKRFILHFSYPSQIVENNLTTLEEKNELNQISEITTYFNSSDLIIDLTNSKESNYELFVYDVLGQLVVQKQIKTKGIETIHIKGKDGYYFVKLVSGNDVHTNKLLKLSSF